MNYTTNSAAETIAIGKKIASTLIGGDILYLHGDLGAGKTTLVKGIAQCLNISNEITSPTFTLMNIYKILNHKSPDSVSTESRILDFAPKQNRDKIKNLIHIDTYRLKDENELLEIGAMDYIGQPDTVTMIEWPEKIENLLKNYRQIKNITLKHRAEQKREIISQSDCL